MGDKAGAAAAAEPETPPVEVETDDHQEPSPLIFSVGEEDETPSETPDKKDDKPVVAEDTDLKKQVEELKKETAKQQALLNKKFYELRKSKKETKSEGDDKPAFTDAQLLKILEEHQGEPAVLLQVMKHMSEIQASKTEKQAVEGAEIRQQQSQAEAWLHATVPGLYEDGSEIRMQTDTVKEKLKLDNHPMGDFFATTAILASTLPQRIAAERADERKKVLAELGESARKKELKGAAPAGGKTSKTTAGAVSDAEFTRQGKEMQLTGSALKLYVEMRRNAAKPSKQVMEA